jgi:hypothetical protein
MSERPTTFEDMIDRQYQTARDLMVNRHKKYGAGNIARHGLVGVAVRLGDKLARMDEAVLRPNADIFEDESLRDTLTDILNYAAIGLCWLDGDWTKTSCPPLAVEMPFIPAGTGG